MVVQRPGGTLESRPCWPWSHRWTQWTSPTEAKVRGVSTYVQIRKCTVCNKAQFRNMADDL